MTKDDLVDKTVYWIPRNSTLYNYKIVWQFMNYPKSLLNSVLLTTVVRFLIQLLSCAMVAYGFASF